MPATEDYCQEYLPPSIVEKLEAGAFRQLCLHLQERSDEVQNIELMTLAGFCRNCLAKWMVVEARKMVDQGGAKLEDIPIESLNALGYEEAAQHVYGMTYSQWKSRHQKKVTDEQMERYKASEPIQAKHDKHLLETRGEKPSIPLTTDSTVEKSNAAPLSNVCCQDVEEVAASKDNVSTLPKRRSEEIGPFVPPPLPTLSRPVCVAVLTISDRAFRKEYSTGDLSGPAVVSQVQKILSPSQLEILPTEIVPDEMQAIQDKLKMLTKNADIVLTTGGTGMSPRDVTPEATREVLDLECSGLMSFVAMECSRFQPLASLTRGTAGIMDKSLVANLPGNPKGVGEILPILMPLLMYALQDMRD